MFGFATRQDPVTGARVVDIPWVIDAIRALGLVVVIITVSLARPRPGTDTVRGLAIAVTLGLSAAAWIVWMSTRSRPRMTTVSLVVMGAAGGVLAGLSPNSPAVAIGCAAAFGAGARLRPEVSLAIMAETVACFLVAGLVVGAPAGALLGYSFAFAGLWSVSLTRREFLVRAEQAEHMLAETRRAREAENQAAALAERARIARDIHDVLAHSLAAVSVNLQAAGGLLTADSLPADNPELSKAIECIDRAGTLTREGLATARRAILALRDEAAPLPDQLSSLVGEYRATGDLAVDFTVSGTARPLSAEVSLVAFRTAQEALTNARKHATAAPVELCLDGAPGHGLTIEVRNPTPALATAEPKIPGTGAGLLGLTERATLSGGRLEHGLDEHGHFRLHAWLPWPQAAQ